MTPVEQLQQGLEGSPYSIGDDETSRGRAEFLVPKLEDIERRCADVRDRLRLEIIPRLQRSQRVREIFESNAIEGLGLPLPETARIVTKQESQGLLGIISRYTIEQLLYTDNKVRDVIGLHGAQLLARDIVAHQEHPISEVDIRNLHTLILRGEEAAGRYKRFVNRIKGSRHEPSAPTDAPGHMARLTSWFSDTPAPALLRAAAVHAWLTHIHPFEDGNGRVARLLANMAISRNRLPPLIIKSSSDRGRYIDALAHSDEGGDLLPLLRLFTRVVNRAIREFENPDFALKLFQEDLAIRGATTYQWWLTEFSAFLEGLSAKAILNAFSVEQIGSLAPSDFALLKNYDSTGNSWIAALKSESSDLDLLIWVGYPSFLMRRTLEEGENFPSLFFAARNRSLDEEPYIQISRINGFPIDEMMLLPGSPTRFRILGTRRVWSLSTEDGCDLLLSAISQFNADVIRGVGTYFPDAWPVRLSRFRL